MGIVTWFKGTYLFTQLEVGKYTRRRTTTTSSSYRNARKSETDIIQKYIDSGMAPDTLYPDPKSKQKHKPKSKSMSSIPKNTSQIWSTEQELGTVREITNKRYISDKLLDRKQTAATPKSAPLCPYDAPKCNTSTASLGQLIRIR